MRNRDQLSTQRKGSVVSTQHATLSTQHPEAALAHAVLRTLVYADLFAPVSPPEIRSPFYFNALL